MASFIEKLNPQQKAAVTLPAVNALILAGAGSGKTRVLTTRIAWLIEQNISPMSILAVTFTNKAAKEMLTRINASIAVNTRGMWVGTFHGLCNRMLRRHFKEAGLPQTFQILDQSDQLSAIKRLMKTHGISEENFPPREIQGYISRAKEDGLRAKDLIANAFGQEGQKAKIYALYEEQCNREGVADFGELLMRSYELLARNEMIRHHYQERFRFILVDEFQDTNRLQYKWLKLLAGFDANGCKEYDNNSVFAVGDDDQSIYAFRGARVGNMTDFQRDFNVKHLIKLEQNYRSFGHILNAANDLIANNDNRLGKNLWTSSGDGERIRVFRADTDREEAEYCVQEIREAIGRGVPRQEIALLYRSNAQSRVLEQALTAAGIPYKVYGGMRFFDRAEIKHALAYLRLIENPKDDTAFLRVVNFPMRGIGAKSMEALQQKALEAQVSFYEASALLEGAAGSKIRAFCELIDTMRFEFTGLTLPDLIAGVVDRSGLLAHYQKEREGQDRIENLEELQNAATAYLLEEGIGVDSRADELEPDAQDDEMTSLAGFLSHAALESGDNQAQKGEAAVQMMTVHAAKGLEFDVVFITGVEEGLFPHANSARDDDSLSEERRLMYVAITRARKSLHITFALSRMLRGQYFDSGPSVFLDEIGEEHLLYLYDRRRSTRAEDEDQSLSWDDDADNRRGRRSWGDRDYGSGYSGSRSNYGGYGSRSGYSKGYSGGYSEGYGRRYGRQTDTDARRSTGFARAKADPAVQKIVARKEFKGFGVGNRVQHPKFGEGRVLKLSGLGDDARITVQFDDVGTKELLLSLAKLTKLS